MKEIKKGKRELCSIEETKALGFEIADALDPGDIVALVGDLGVGKTALTKYIAEGLGVKEEVISPTFTIVKLYESGRIPLAHFDVYRLSGPEELWDTGASEILGGRYASVMEWADIVADALPGDSLLISLTYADDNGKRIAEIV